jgi:hypothetical protein
MSNAKCREQRRQIQLGSTGQRATKTDGSRSGTRYACNENDPEPMKPGPYRVRKGVRASPCASIRPRLIRSPPASDPSFLLVAMGARVYDPWTGTFTQPDPVKGGGANAYGYTNGDPVNETDLGGREIDPDVGGSGGPENYDGMEASGGGATEAAKPIARIYQASPKHGAEDTVDSQGRVVSRAPTNGQGALDNSTQIKPTSPTRQGIDPDTGDTVILPRTLRQEFPDRIVEYYHGYVR